MTQQILLTSALSGNFGAWELAFMAAGLFVGGFVFIPFIIALAVSFGQSILSRYLTPKVQRGKLTGDLFIQNSEEGLPVHTVYGGGITDRAVGVTWTNLTKVIVQNDGSIIKTTGDNNCFENASGSGDGGARSVEVISGGNWELQFSFDSVTEGRVFCGLTTSSGYTADYTQMRYCVHVSDQNNTSGTPHPPHSWFIYENGGPSEAFGDGEYASGKQFNIVCIDNVVKYYLAGRLIHTSSTAPTYPLYVAASIACLNKTVDNVVLVRDEADNRGGIKLAGNVVWSEPPHKVKGKPAGGKAGPRVEEITYYTSLAVMPGHGPWNIKKIWGNGRLLLNLEALAGSATGALGNLDTDNNGVIDIYIPPNPGSGVVNSVFRRFGSNLQDQNGDPIVSNLLDGAAVRIYDGSYRQLPDSLIQTDLGAANAPAYRGRALVVFQNFNISKFGGSVPTFFFLVEHKELKTLGPILDELADSVGIEPADRDFSDFDSIQVRGIEASTLDSPRGVMEVFEAVYNADFFESADGSLTGKLLGGASEITIDPKYYGAVDGQENFTDGEPVPLLDVAIRNEIELPGIVNVTAYDPAKEYEKTNQPARRQAGFAVGQQTVDLPMTLLVDDIRRVAERVIYRSHIERETISVSLPPRFGYIDPGTVVTLNDSGVSIRARVRGIKGLYPGAQTLSLVRDQAEVFTQTISGASGDGYAEPPVTVQAGTIPIVFDTVTLRDSDDRAGYYLAVAPTSNNDWLRTRVYEDKGADYQLIATIEDAATIGTAVSALANGDATSWDYTTTLDIDLYPGGALESATELQCLNGANAALLGDEIIQFQTATKLGSYDNRWRLSGGILRGRRGTDYGTSTHQSGERFVLLDGAVKFIETDLSTRGIGRNIKAVTEGQALSDVPYGAFTWDAGTLKPLSVVDVAGSRDGSNNLTITWKRRTRIGGQWVDGIDVPLGEASEAYDVDIMSGSTVIRTISTTSQVATYSAANQTTDGFTPGDSITVRIYQISALVGRGRVRQATV